MKLFFFPSFWLCFRVVLVKDYYIIIKTRIIILRYISLHLSTLSFNFHAILSGIPDSRDLTRFFWNTATQSKDFSGQTFFCVSLVVDKQGNVGNLYKTTWKAFLEDVLLNSVIWNDHLMHAELVWYIKISYKATVRKQ